MAAFYSRTAEIWLTQKDVVTADLDIWTQIIVNCQGDYLISVVQMRSTKLNSSMDTIIEIDCAGDPHFEFQLD